MSSENSDLSPEDGIGKPVHASVLLERIIDEAPPGHFTLKWLLEQLPQHSFGFVMLFLALVTLLPVISVVSRILIIVLTWQIILGYPGPVLPDRYALRPLPTKYLVRLRKWACPALRRLEIFVRPRWPLMLHRTRRPAAFLAMTLIALSLPAPIPLINMPPAIITALMAMAYIERDGLLLFIALMMVVASGLVFFL